jgi:hypothetical protein
MLRFFGRIAADTAEWTKNTAAGMPSFRRFAQLGVEGRHPCRPAIEFSPHMAK